MFLKEVSYAHPDCIYLIKNKVILWNKITIENNICLFHIFLNAIYYCYGKTPIITALLQRLQRHTILQKS